MVIGERLISEGLISKDQLEIATKVQRENRPNEMIGTILVEMGFITEGTLSEILAESTGVEQFNPKTSVLDSTLIKQVPKEIALRFKAVPVLLEDDKVHIAMADIYNVLAIDRIQRYFPKNYKMVPLHCTEADLTEIIDNYYQYELSIDGIIREIEGSEVDVLAKIAEQQSYTNPTVRLIDALLVDAIRVGASDIHFEPENNFLRLRYRVDGKLRHVRSFHKSYWTAIAVRIKIISGMNIAESRKPQDGRITSNVLGRQVDFRVATQPTIHGENIVLRILDKKKALLPMEKLGYSEHNVKTLQLALKRPEGIIIVTGPTGSGKTTTLYSILNYINTPDVNIMTIEDPVEYQLSMIRQTNIREGAGMTFAAGIKSILRQDPDIIFVGEVRDEETSEMALRAAMTGHRVFTTLHTNDALGAIPRLVDIGIKPKMLSGAVIACIAQRLARRLCSHCKKQRPATLEECKILGVDEKNPPEIYEHAGCEHCSFTGYKGRVALSEVILVDKELDEMIAEEATRGEMMRHLISHGFVPMPQDGIYRVLQGMTDLPEVISTVDMTERLQLTG
ncbi:MAG: Flp pilus assembly complex ATPase component TadA [Hyphomicrobiales bacterium]|nr:Flp pilus assembly complex ATPase component TadA [Hyphomicrobiales bacterium]